MAGVLKKKSPAKRASSPVLDSSGKKKRSGPSQQGLVFPGDVDLEDTACAQSPATSEVDSTLVSKQYVFKNPNFTSSNKNAGRRGPGLRAWKTLKQIMVNERSLSRKQNEVTYESLDAPPSFKPAKKYSDLSGLLSKYTDPQTKIRYTNPEEFSRIKLLPSDIINGYLALRKSTVPR